MLHTHYLFKRPVYQYLSDKLQDIPRNTERNIDMAHDVISDIIKSNDAKKITCPLNVVQHILIDSLSIVMLEWKKDIYFYCSVVQ